MEEPRHQHERHGFRILRKEQLTPVTNRFVLAAPLVARAAKPGQFVIVRVIENGERIPVTIADFDPAAGTVTVVVQEVGRTSKLFGALMAGQQVLDLVGPLGEPYRPTHGKLVIGVGGGFGAAALYPLVRSLRQAGVPTEAVIGARTKEFLILEEELSRVCRQVMPCTDDGSFGFKGFVTDRLKQRLEELPQRDPEARSTRLASPNGTAELAQDSAQPMGPVGLHDVEVVAVGPMPMMRAVSALTEQYHVATQVSLDSIMVDGTGMCGGCRVTIKGEVKFACVDGPFFNAHQVDFAECMRRNKMYRQEEATLNAAEANA